MAKEKLIAVSEVKKKLSAIRKYFSGYPSTEQDKLARSVVKLCMEEVEKINPADAVEVVHGRWEKVDHDGSWRVDRCSICHRRMHYVDYDQPYAYCPNCGAKMDGERRTDNA